MKFKIIANLVVFLTLIFLSSCSSIKTVPSSQAYNQNTRITSFSKSKKLLLKLYKAHPDYTVVVPTMVRNQTCPPVDTSLRRIINVQTELNGNMLSLHMHSVSHLQNGEMVIPSVSTRMGRSLREGSVQKR